MVPKTEKPKIQMQKYFIKPPTVDNKNPNKKSHKHHSNTPHPRTLMVKVPILKVNLWL